MNFLTKSTKIKCIVESVITALAFITLIMLSTLLSISKTSKTTLTLIYTVSLMLILLMWQGIIQIQVFNDYKSKNPWLCADGILSICMSILLIVSAILLSILQIDKIIAGTLTATSDIRIFLTCFLFVIACWKFTLIFKAFKNKHFNWWCELLFTIFWSLLMITVFISMFISNLQVITWIIISLSWLLIVLNIFYVLYSYVIKKPDYLENDQNKEIYEQEQTEKQLRKQIALTNELNDTSALELRLNKLKNLKDNKIITEKEYKERREEVLRDI